MFKGTGNWAGLAALYPNILQPDRVFYCLATNKEETEDGFVTFEEFEYYFAISGAVWASELGAQFVYVSSSRADYRSPIPFIANLGSADYFISTMNLTRVSVFRPWLIKREMSTFGEKIFLLAHKIVSHNFCFLSGNVCNVLFDFQASSIGLPREFHRPVTTSQLALAMILSAQVPREMNIKHSVTIYSVSSILNCGSYTAKKKQTPMPSARADLTNQRVVVIDPLEPLNSTAFFGQDQVISSPRRNSIKV